MSTVKMYKMYLMCIYILEKIIEFKYYWYSLFNEFRQIFYNENGYTKKKK